MHIISDGILCIYPVPWKTHIIPLCFNHIPWEPHIIPLCIYPVPWKTHIIPLCFYHIPWKTHIIDLRHLSCSMEIHIVCLLELLIPDQDLPLEDRAIMVLKRLSSSPIGASWINLMEKHPIRVSCSFPEHGIIPHSTVKVPKGL